MQTGMIWTQPDREGRFGVGMVELTVYPDRDPMISSDSEEEESLPAEKVIVQEPFSTTGFRNPLYQPANSSATSHPKIISSSNISSNSLKSNPIESIPKESTRKSSRMITPVVRIDYSLMTARQKSLTRPSPAKSTPKRARSPPKITKPVIQAKLGRSKRSLNSTVISKLSNSYEVLPASPSSSAEEENLQSSDFEYTDEIPPRLSRNLLGTSKPASKQSVIVEIKPESESEESEEEILPKKRRKFTPPLPITLPLPTFSLSPSPSSPPVSTTPPLSTTTWSKSQDALLIFEINLFGPDYLKILSRHGSKGSISSELRGRTGKELKRRAEDLKQGLEKISPDIKRLREDW